MIECVPEDIRQRGRWKDEFFNYCDGIDCTMFFKEAEEKKKTKNHRCYIGPGADGSTEDKIAVELKFDPKNTVITYKAQWRELGYCKSTWVLYGDRWKLTSI